MKVWFSPIAPRYRSTRVQILLNNPLRIPLYQYVKSLGNFQENGWNVYIHVLLSHCRHLLIYHELFNLTLECYSRTVNPTELVKTSLFIDR